VVPGAAARTLAELSQHCRERRSSNSRPSKHFVQDGRAPPGCKMQNFVHGGGEDHQTRNDKHLFGLRIRGLR
jgi:hypothetical protein